MILSTVRRGGPKFPDTLSDGVMEALQSSVSQCAREGIGDIEVKPH